MKVVQVFIFLYLLYSLYCYTNFTKIEICSLYKQYPQLTGNYGQKGISSSTNHPGARRFSMNVYSKSTNTLWVFGGEGYGVDDDSMGNLNDLWKFDFNTNEWTWMSGGTTINLPASYVQVGVPNSNNVPGSRHGGCMWEDSNGNLWLFGGYGRAPNGNTGYLNDLWKYEAGVWTLVRDKLSPNAESTYAADRVFSSSAYPGGRAYCSCWKDSNGHFWLYGGTSGNEAYRAETWAFDGTNWAYWCGKKTINDFPHHSTPREFAFNYHPGGRSLAAVAVSGNEAYLVGGLVSGQRYGDIWKFDKTKGWTIWGGREGTHTAIPNTIRVFQEANKIASKHSPMVVIDDFSNLWIFGGYGQGTSGEPGGLNGLWVYNQEHFAWISGDPTTTNLENNLVTGSDTMSSSNIPGGFYSHSSAFLDKYGLMNMFGLQYGFTETPTNMFWQIGFGHECFGKSICRHPPNQVCSGHGKCVNYNQCVCESGYMGQQCQTLDVYCYGIHASNPSVCSGRGSCIATNQCSCDQPSSWGGEQCDIPKCDGKLANDETVCNSRGTCNAPDICTCTNPSQWTGAFCEVPICFSKAATDETVCSSRGTCVGPNSCDCNNGYAGDQCQYPVCFDKSSNDPTVCSGNGECVEPDSCSCSSGYTGDQCDIPICFGKNANDPSVCSSRGTCTEPDQCDCENGYTGNECQLAVCFGKNQSDPTVCSAHGSCVSKDQCVCDVGYTGDQCEIPICFGKLSNDTSVCSGHGDCVQPDTCECNPFWTGSKCEIPICFGKRKDDVDVCSGNGDCVGPNQCECVEGYTGQECELECPNPLITSSRYSLDATKVVIALNKQMQMNPIACSDIFQDANKLGENAQCEFSNPSELVITLDEKIPSGDTLTFKPNVLKDAECGQFVQAETITILPPIGVQEPVAVINAPPIFGKCNDLTLESASYGYGPLKHYWEHVNEPPNQYSTGIATLLSNLSDTTTSVTISSSYMDIGTIMFRLTVKDLYLQSSTTTIVVEKSDNDEIPISQIAGPIHKTVKRSDGFFIDTQTRFSPCTSTTGKRLQFSWSSQPSLVFVATKNTPKLFVPPYSLQLETPYKFTLTVSVINIDSGEELASSTIDAFATAEPSHLVAKISGGSSRTISTTSTLVLDASNSYDPDDPQTQLQYQWSCCKQVGDSCDIEACLTSFGDLPSTPVYTREAPLPEGTFVFSVNVSSTDGRFANANTEITINTESIPIVTIKRSESEVHNTGRPLILTATVKSDSSEDLIYSWTVVEGNLDLQDESVAPFGTNQLQLYIEGSKLTEPRYIFKFFAASKSSPTAVGSAQILVNINLPPFGGQLVSNVQQAKSLQDTITLTTSGWTDVSEDLPLRYIFYQVIELENGETVDQPLHAFPQSKPEFSFIAPVVDKDTEVTFKVVAFDNKNAGASATTTVTILAFQKEANESNEDFAEKLMNENLMQLLNEGNFEKIMRYIDHIAEVIRLSTGADAIQKRKLLKDKLIELYKAVFSLNVNFINGDLRKSVISTLAKLLGKSDEISDEASSNTLKVLSLTFNTQTETTIHTVLEALPEQVGKQAVSAISNLIEASGFDEKNQTEKITKTITEIGKLALVDKPAGTKVKFDSSQIDLVQAREYVSQVIEKSVQNDDSEITIPNGVFDNLDPVKRDLLGFIDIRLLKWNKNPHAYVKVPSDITGPVISADLLDDSGNELKIENLKNPIQIKIPSKHAKSGIIECRFLNTKSNQWETIGLAQVKDGEYTICTTSHLSDFATFIANTDESPQNTPSGGFNLNWLWLLMLIIPGVALLGTLIALFSILYKRQKRNSDKVVKSSKGNLTPSNASPEFSSPEIVDEAKVIIDDLPEVPGIETFKEN